MFEPLEAVTLEAIKYKMFVLIALTLGAHRDELCALRRGQFVHPAVDWSFVLLYSDPSFFPITAKGSLPTEPYKLPPSIPLGRRCGPVPCKSLAGIFFR